MFEVGEWLEKKKLGMPYLCENGIVPILVRQAKATAYWKDRTSHARNGINGGVEGGFSNFNIYLGHSTDYGQYLEEGTGVYGPTGQPIVPVRAKILSWVDTDGKRYYARKVKGIKPHHTLEKTLMNNKQPILELLVEYWEG